MQKGRNLFFFFKYGKFFLKLEMPFGDVQWTMIF